MLTASNIAGKISKGEKKSFRNGKVPRERKRAYETAKYHGVQSLMSDSRVLSVLQYLLENGTLSFFARPFSSPDRQSRWRGSGS